MTTHFGWRGLAWRGGLAGCFGGTGLPASFHQRIPWSVISSTNAEKSMKSGFTASTASFHSGLTLMCIRFLLVFGRAITVNVTRRFSPRQVFC